MNDTHDFDGPRAARLPAVAAPFGSAAISRRRFLSLLSASAALAAGTSCSKIDRGPIVAYTRRPGEAVPGVAAYYASTFQEGMAAHAVLVKTREGRPIHIEGNPENPASRGGFSLRATGDLLGLYDPDRLRSPVRKSGVTTWDEAQKALARTLSGARGSGRPVLLLTGAVISPTQQSLIGRLTEAVPGLRHEAWEPAGPQAEMLAAQALYGRALTAKLRLDRADVILALQSDFLGTETDAPMHIRDFAARRSPARSSDAMNRLWVIEGGLSLTGSNADQRLQARPSGIASVAFSLIRLLHVSHSVALPAGLRPQDLRAFDPDETARRLGADPSVLRLLAADLARTPGASLVLAGPALPPEAHVACRLLNIMLQAEGNTLDSCEMAGMPRLAATGALRDILAEAADGKFAAAIFWDANPAYAFPDPSLWARAIARIPESYRIGLYEDETALDCDWRLPEHHWLESWGDFRSGAGFIGLRQPAIAALHRTRQAEDFLLSCMRELGIETAPGYLEYLRRRWQSDVYPGDSPVPFDGFWNAALHDGGVKRDCPPPQTGPIRPGAVHEALAAAATAGAAGWELILSPGAGVYDGRYANNGWLNELPDPVTKATWANPLRISPVDAANLGLRDGDPADVSVGPETVTCPVIVQPGQAPGVAEVSLGYGRRTGSVAVGIGVNAYPMTNSASGSPFLVRGIRISRSEGGARRPIPRTQQHDRMEGRDLARSWTRREYERRAGQPAGESPHHTASLIPEPKFPEHKWGMVIDLAACVGCSAGVVACQSENNVAVVGPERVREGRHMHWIRVDRYYEGDARNPAVRHQPVLCQHCDNAPCEIVCPVNATTHSADGLNQMAYNRCVGTRYCSNNCPFKVRRFNFFDYTSDNREPEILAHNQEVTVRPRGVMEKCTFCIQRIQDARRKAKTERRRVADGEIQPACAAACPAGAIVFGDVNDANSRVARLSKSDRNYRMLEELGIKPSVTYLADISNPAAGRDQA